VLVDGLAVEAGEREGVLREMPGTQSMMTPKPAWCSRSMRCAGRRAAEAARRRVVAGHLIAPGAAERVLGHGQELDVGEAGLGDVLDELVGDVAVAEARAPRSEVQLVDDIGCATASRRAAGHPRPSPQEYASG
jgi:hypothetical protein